MLQKGIWPPRMARRMYGLVLFAALSFGAASGLANAQPAAAPAEPLPNRPTIEAGGLEIRDVTFGTPGVRTGNIGRGVFSGLRHGDGVVRAERVVFERVTIYVEGRQLVIPEITASDVTLPIEWFRAFTEGTTAAHYEPVALLMRMAAAEIRIPSIADGDSATRGKARFTNMVYSGLKQGTLASGRWHQSRTDTVDVDGSVHTVTIENTAEYRGIDIAEIWRFASGRSSNDDGAAKRLLESSTINAFRLNVTDGSEIAIERIEVAGLFGRAPVSPFPMRPPSRIAPAGKPDTHRADTAHYIREVLQNLRLDQFAMSGIQIRSPDFGALAIAGVSVANLSGNGIEKFEVAGTELSGSPLDVKLERLTLEKLVYGDLLSRMLDALMGAEQIELSPEWFAQSRSQLSAMRLAGLTLDTPAGPLAVANISVESDPPDLAAIPERVTLSINGLSLDLEKGAQALGPTNLLRLGYRQIKADGRVQFRSIAGERALVMDDTRIAIAEMGSLDLAMRLGNIDLGAAASNPQLSDGILDAAQIESMELRATDAGFADRFYAQLARDSGLPEDALRTASAQEMKGHAAHLFAGALPPGAADALATFIRKPGRLVIRATPKPGQPLKLSDLDKLSPPELNARLTISIEATAN